MTMMRKKKKKRRKRREKQKKRPQGERKNWQSLLKQEKEQGSERRQN